MMKIITSILLIFMVSFASHPYLSLGNHQEANFTVELQPIRVDTAATYILRVKFEKPIAAKDLLSIQWPEDTKMPELPEDPSQRRAALEKLVETIYIGAFPCGSCHSPPTLNEKERTLTFSFPRNINPSDPEYTYTTIVIPDRAGFINPSKAGSYTMNIHTATNGTMKSIPYAIVESQIGVPEGKPSVSVDPGLPFTSAAYTIEFNVGQGGGLIANQSRIRLRFPTETEKLKEDLPTLAYHIQVNGIPLRASYAWNQNLLLIISPVSVPNAGKVTIYISKEAGIINPKRNGSYQLEVSTSEDREWVSSLPYTISSIDIPLSIKPNKTTRKAQFDLLISLEERWILDENNPLFLRFPKSFAMPENLPADSIEINHQKIAQINLKDHVLTIFPSTAIHTDEPVFLSILNTSGIFNPADTGPVQLEIKTSIHEQWHTTRAVYLEAARLMIQHVRPQIWNACESSAYDIRFELGNNGQLNNEDWISIIFPESYTLPSSMDSATVWLNQEPVNRIELIDSYEIRIFPGQNIESYEIDLHFSEDAGLINPCEGNQEYQLWFLTSKESDIIASPLYFIAPVIPKASAQWISGKKGNSSWYVQPPVMEIASSDLDAELWFSWNNPPKEQFERYRGMQEMPDGFYRMTLYYFVRDTYGESEIQALELKVDTFLPQFEIHSPPYPINYINQKTIEISGMVEKQAFDDRGQQKEVYDPYLEIAGKQIEVSPANGSFLAQLEITSQNQEIEVILRDEAGWSSKKTIHFYLDTDPPRLTDINPAPLSTLLHSSIHLQATSKPFSEVWINQEPVWVGNSGNIDYRAQVGYAGKHEFNVEVKDRFGNEYSEMLAYWFGLTIRMQIGNKVMECNEKTQINDVAPLILHQSTYLPVRILSEMMHAELEVKTHILQGTVEEVSWKTPFHHILMKVGKREAMVNGKAVYMTVPPEIVQNRLMMPVRWMIEQMGGTVQWQAESQEILIHYLEQEIRK